MLVYFYAVKSNIMRIIFLLPLCLVCTIVQAQFLRGIVNKATDKAIDRVEDKIADRLAEELANAMYRPIDKALDSLLQNSYEASDSKDTVDYQGFLTMLNNTAELPPSYDFDVVMEMEIMDYDGKKNEMEMWFDESGNHFGMKQYEKKNSNLVIIDTQRDIICMYTEEKGKKRVQAIPTMSKWMTYAGGQSVDLPEIKVTPLNKTKSIAGYECDGYDVESEEELSTVWMTNDLPVTWKDGLGKFIAQFNSERMAQYKEELNGMFMESETQLKKDKKKKSSWKTKKVDTSGKKLDNSEYERQSFE